MAATAKAWTGAINAVVISAVPVTVTGFNYNNTIAGTTVVTMYDNASAASGTILYQSTIAASNASTIKFPKPIRAKNGVTMNASVGLGAAGAVYAS
jgi:hypothetical protein